jgi:hypothetical protein
MRIYTVGGWRKIPTDVDFPRTGDCRSLYGGGDIAIVDIAVNDIAVLYIAGYIISQ